jgi:hypothetical protein
VRVELNNSLLIIDHSTKLQPTIFFVAVEQTDCDQVDQIAGVRFNIENNIWEPDKSIPGMTTRPLSATPPEDACFWFFKRQTIGEFVKSRTAEVADPPPDKSMMTGEACFPVLDGYCDCGSPWTSSTLSMLCWFVVRTTIGAVARRRFRRTCSCGTARDWDPASEYIHAISFYEGGKS